MEYTILIERDDVKKGINRVKKSVMYGIKKGINKTLKEIRNEAKAILSQKIREKHAQKPWLKNSGNLRKSIRIHTSGTFNLSHIDYRGIVFTDVEYATYVEFDGIDRDFKGYYFMKAGHDKGKEIIQDEIKSAIMKELMKEFGGK